MRRSDIMTFRILAKVFTILGIVSCGISLPIIAIGTLVIQYLQLTQTLLTTLTIAGVVSFVVLILPIIFGSMTLKYLSGIKEGIRSRVIEEVILAFVFVSVTVGAFLLFDYIFNREINKEATKDEDKVLLNEPSAASIWSMVKKTLLSFLYYFVGATLSLLFILPLLYMIAASTKDPETIAFNNNSILMFIPDFTHITHIFDNYNVVIFQFDVWKYALNSFIYAAIVIVFNVLVNGLAGYVLAKFHFPAKGFFSFIILFLIVVPVETSIIPLYSIVKQILGLKGSLSVLGVILPSIISVFNIFLFTQFFSSIPKEYEEAMRIDGGSRVRIFFDLVLPLSKPIVTTTVVFTFIGVWNDYVWPSMVLPNTGDESWPLLPIQAALTSIQSIENITTGQIMASLVITSIPIFVLYALAQKYIVKGFGTAGLKM